MSEIEPGRDALDFRDREALFRLAEERPFDLIVIGAGITGAGIARSASARGFRVAHWDVQGGGIWKSRWLGFH